MVFSMHSAAISPVKKERKSIQVFGSVAAVGARSSGNFLPSLQTDNCSDTKKAVWRSEKEKVDSYR